MVGPWGDKGLQRDAVRFLAFTHGWCSVTQTRCFSASCKKQVSLSMFLLWLNCFVVLHMWKFPLERKTACCSFFAIISCLCDITEMHSLLWSMQFFIVFPTWENVNYRKWPFNRKAHEHIIHFIARMPSLEEGIIFPCKKYYFNIKVFLTCEYSLKSGVGPDKILVHLIFLPWIYCATLFIETF